MVRSLLLIFCIVLFVFGLQAQSIQNAGFERGDLSGWTFETPATYGAREAGYISRIVRDSSFDGSFALQIASTQNSQWCQLKQGMLYKPVDSMERLRVSAAVKLQNGTHGSAGIMLRTYAGGKDFGITGSGLDRDSGWTLLSCEVVITKQTDSLLLFCSMSGQGAALFDNVKIEKIALGAPRQTPEARAYLDTALHIISQYALYRDSVDFKELIAQAHLLAIDAQNTTDCYPAIQHVVKGLGDRHSFFLTAAQTHGSNGDTVLVLPTGKRMDGNIGYLKVPPFAQADMSLHKKYAAAMQHIIQSLDRENIRGWIVDNRNNGGGNPYPMFLGLGPLLGDGVFNRSREINRWSDSMMYHSGEIHIFNGGRDSVVLVIDKPYSIHNTSAKVAVLINDRTASSGEMVTLSFLHKPGARIFGEPTYGISTLPHDHFLSDSALLVVFTAKQTDRLGNRYGGKIYPDETVSDIPNTNTDEVIEAAVKWLLVK